MSDLPQFLLAGFALAGSPGPNTLSMAAVGAAFGRREAIGYLLGLSVGMLGVIALVGTGTAGLLLAVPGAAPVITGLAALYFLWLAWRIANASPIGPADSGRRPPRWHEGALLSMMNPKAYAAMAALFSGFTLRPAPLPDALTKTLLAFAVILTVNAAWMVIGTLLTRLAGNPRTARAINYGFAAALLISVAATTLL
ncbi:LysE family translocator [Sagittula stellata]|uniref:Transporter, LysE family protein n=1 Tax=Sagittula stellata (strain ATCC 700073 / DSM 11524 / E-37) TaxID=388399 RepID=A3K999_SAGS3|nr:LysE family translocator [Sagittula stellata]EBA06271.1 hypothetical protein SSE37_15351 [Sagittula stellata E-37]